MRCTVALALLLLAAPASAQCAGDCDGDGTVRVAELVGLVECALGASPRLASCLTCADGDASGAIEVHELLSGVANALDGCPRFTLRVSLEEFPGEGEQLGACVTVEPPGLQTMQGPPYELSLPPGRYEIAPALACAGPPCTPFGCWPSRVPVEIIDRDVMIRIAMRHTSCRGDRGECASAAICVPPGGVLCGVCSDDPDACTGDDDCGTQQVCVPTRLQVCPCDGSPALECAPACGSADDCVRGEQCGSDGRCRRPGCVTDAECAGGYCVLGHCYDELGTCQVPPP